MPASLKAGVIAKEQPNKQALIAQICARLLRLVKLYQIPNFDEEAAVLLAEDTLERFQYEPIETILRCLDSPPSTGEKNWRLTPDTISTWMQITIEKDAEERERINQLYKTKDAQEMYTSADIPEHVNQLIEEYKAKLKEGIKPIAPLTEKEVKQEGQHRPKKPAYNSPKQECYEEWRKKIRDFQYRTVKERHPELSEDEVDNIVNNLPV